MMKMFTKKNLLFTIVGIFTVLIVPKAAAQTYATLPFSENFENAWVNKDGTRDVPSAYWKNTPATTDSSWSRDDDGVARGAWLYNGGSYSPAGANSSSHSARFHSYYAAYGYSGKLDLYVNFSTGSGNIGLSFWYINTTGTDSLKVYLSTDGGTTFGNPVISLGTKTGWTKIKFNLGTVTTTTGVIRFKAKSDFGFSDIGVDEVNVGGLMANFTADVTYGAVPLTVHFTDQSSGSPTAWQWDFNNDGVVDATTQNPTYIYNTVGTYTVKLVVSKTGSTDTIVKTNYIAVNAYASLPFSENFDNTWINRDNTRDVPSQYWKNTPATGDNSWSRDDDGVARGAWSYNGGSYSPAGANGSLHSARFHSYDAAYGYTGTLDLYMNFSTASGNQGLSFWYINTSGTDSLMVYLSTDGGTTFGNPVCSLKNNTGWTKIVVNLGNVTTSTGIIRFVATSDYSNDIGLDEVKVGGVAANFTADATLGTMPLTVHFTDQSLGNPTAWKWDFNNDGIVDATTQNPTYIYSNAGDYSVKLVASKTGSTDSTIKTNYITVNTYASLPFSETFDNTWINRGNTRDVPSQYWKNTPATGDNSWSRDDDGVARGAWSYNGGSYSPPGANSSTYSARFHSYWTTSSGTLDCFINFASVSGNKTLSYWYINTDGTDSIAVYLSIDGGSTFGSVLNSQTVKTSWTQITVNLGNITAANGVLRFKAFGDYGDTDLGLDEISINTSVIPVVAQFTANTTTGVAPLVVTFTNQSSGNPTAWKWDFNNDGVVDAITQNPTYTYTTAGTYTVKLVASKTGSKDSTTKVNYITVTTTTLTPVVALFTANPVTGDYPLQVQFTDQSTGNPTVWKWDFNNDGIVDATAQNPTYTYTTAGTYTVKLVASKTGSKDSTTKVNYITVTTPALTPVVALFTADTTTGNVPLKVHFYDQSTGNPTAWKWDFNNDGVIDTTVQSPFYTFKSVGVFTVKLIVSKTGSKDSITKTNYINVNVLPPHVGISTANSQEEAVNIYPNPTDGMVTMNFINFGNEKTRIEIVDMNGKVVQLTNVENKPICSLDISSLASGIYYIRTICKDKVYINKVIKR